MRDHLASRFGVSDAAQSQPAQAEAEFQSGGCNPKQLLIGGMDIGEIIKIIGFSGNFDRIAIEATRFPPTKRTIE